MFIAVNLLMLIALILMAGFASTAAGFSEAQTDDVMDLTYAAYQLFVLLPTIAVSVRRLHDIGNSGWWLLIIFVPFVGGLIMLIFTIRNSDPGSNQYGPNPKTHYPDVPKEMLQDPNAVNG